MGTFSELVVSRIAYSGVQRFLDIFGRSSSVQVVWVDKGRLDIMLGSILNPKFDVNSNKC
jgi:hypothetical protein